LASLNVVVYRGSKALASLRYGEGYNAYMFVSTAFNRSGDAFPLPVLSVNMQRQFVEALIGDIKGSIAKFKRVFGKGTDVEYMSNGDAYLSIPIPGYSTPDFLQTWRTFSDGFEKLASG
jgi:hypothetical protein